MTHFRQPDNVLSHGVPIFIIAHHDASAIPTGNLDFLKIKRTQRDGRRNTIPIRKTTVKRQSGRPAQWHRFPAYISDSLTRPTPG